MASIGYGYGSEWHLLQHLGRRRHAFTRHVEAVTGLAGIVWRDSEEYVDRKTFEVRLREMRGVEFLDVKNPARREWESLWPQSFLLA